MTWIKTIPFEAAEGKLEQMYNRVKGSNNNVDNVLLVHSLRPHTLKGHMTLYKAVLHHHGNTLPKWYLELLGVYVSVLNGCDYCIKHHLAGLARLIEPDRAEQITSAVESGKLHDVLNLKEQAGCRYAHKLTVENQDLELSDIDELRFHGFTDGEILEINQVVSYFNYVNRTVNGLGVAVEGDELGLSPADSDDPENWSHK